MPTVPAEYLSITLEPETPLFANAAAIRTLCEAPQVYAQHPPAEVRATIAKLKRTIQSPDDYGLMYCEALTGALTVELLRWLRPSRERSHHRGGLTPRQARLVCDFIDAHLDQQISLIGLAKLCDLSPGHFCTAFHRTVGAPPHRYQLMRRMEHAKSLLATSNASIIEIALAAGFSSHSSFSARFRAVVGTTPLAFRRSLR